VGCVLTDPYSRGQHALDEQGCKAYKSAAY
jgi:hypothetical protein